MCTLLNTLNVCVMWMELMYLKIVNIFHPFQPLNAYHRESQRQKQMLVVYIEDSFAQAKKTIIVRGIICDVIF